MPPAGGLSGAAGVALLVGTALLTTGCGAAGASEDVSVRDSAGIRIVELSGLPASPIGWVVAASPAVVFGGDTDDERAQLVRVAGAARRSDGRIVVADGGGPALLLFDADGTPAGAFGRSGGGPGEFLTPMLVGLLPGDSALVHDQRQGRFTVVTPEMTLGRMFTAEDQGAFPVAMLPDGLLAVRVRGAGFGDTPASGVYDGASPLVFMGREGALLDTLGTFPRRATYMRIAESSINLLRMPFGTETSYATTRDRLHLGTGASFEILSFGRAGALARILRADVPGRPVTDQDLARYTEAAVARAPEPARPGIRTMYREVPVPEHTPAHGALVTDAAGNLWVQRYRFADEPSTWAVFDPDGAPLGTVTTPDGVTLLEIGDEYILGAGADELDRPYVGVWSLERVPGA